MQRYSEGVKVPKVQTDFFVGKTTSGLGAVTLDLTYQPKSINHIALLQGQSIVGDPRLYFPISLVGKTLSIMVNKPYYKEVDGTSGADAGTGAGGGTHTHAISTTDTALRYEPALTENQNVIAVIYPLS